MIRALFDSALDRAMADVQGEIAENRDELYIAAYKQATIDDKAKKDKSTFVISISVKIDQTGNIVETSLGWNVKEKRETSAFITAPHPDLFRDMNVTVTSGDKTFKVSKE